MRLRGAVLAVVCLGAIFCLWFVFVLSRRGQVVEAAALEGSKIGAHYVAGHARTLLSVVSMPAAGVLVAIILLIGLLRRSHRRAVWAVVAVVGANLSTQALKYWILWRPDYDITARMDNANTFPSGHTTMATSAAVALILLSGRRWRALSAWAGALFAIAMGYSTLACQWHRPSDVIAALLVPVAWGALAVAGGAWDSASYGGAPPIAEEDGSERDEDHSDADEVEGSEDSEDPEDPESPDGAGGESTASAEEADRALRRAPTTGPAILSLRTQRIGNALLALLGAGSMLVATVLGIWVWTRADELVARSVLFASYATGAAAVVGVGCLAMAALVSLTDWGAERHERLP